MLVGALEAAAYTARDSFDAADRSTDRSKWEYNDDYFARLLEGYCFQYLERTSKTAAIVESLSAGRSSDRRLPCTSATVTLSDLS